MNPLDKITSLFSQFPGIGRRQAERFAYFLLQSHPSFIDELTASLSSLKGVMQQCSSCYIFFENKHNQKNTCETCSDTTRDSHTLMIVAKDVDLENIRKSGVYQGKYFVIGGLIPLLDKKRTERVRTAELFDVIKKRAADDGLREIIFALNANPEGDHTTFHIQKLLQPLAQKYSLTITTLGRGLSTGTELEYSDAETIKGAIENRRS